MAKSKKVAEEETKKKGKEKEKPKLTEAMLDAAPLSIAVAVEGQALAGDKKNFSSKSVGWNVNGKVVIGGLKCQVSCNIVIIGSKDVKR